jgi:hypothetical protein
LGILKKITCYETESKPSVIGACIQIQAEAEAEAEAKAKARAKSRLRSFPMSAAYSVSIRINERTVLIYFFN